MVADGAGEGFIMFLYVRMNADTPESYCDLHPLDDVPCLLQRHLVLF